MTATRYGAQKIIISTLHASSAIEGSGACILNRTTQLKKHWGIKITIIHVFIIIVVRTPSLVPPLVLEHSHQPGCTQFSPISAKVEGIVQHLCTDWNWFQLCMRCF